MIDWGYVVTNSLWILGLSMILAAFSYHDWLARESKQSRRDLLQRPSWRLPFSTGMLLFCLGLGLGREATWWEQSLWGVLAISFAWQGGSAFRARRR